VWAGVVTRIAVSVVVMIVAGLPPKSTPMVPARLVPVSSTGVVSYTHLTLPTIYDV